MPTGGRLARLSAAERAAKEHWQDKRTARDQAIEDYDQAGRTIRDIADESGLHPSTVHTIIATRTAARQARTAHALHMDPGPVD